MAASRAPRTSCFLLAAICGIHTPEQPRQFPHRLRHASGGWAMTFEDILDQAIAMLQRQRRAADRTLQGPFSSDDNPLEALQDALLPCPGSGSQQQRSRRPAGVT